MKFVVLSDTHGFHNEIDLPEGDVLLHAGDISDSGDIGEINDFLHWFAHQKHQYKIFIGGNHDIYLDEYPVDFLEYIPSSVRYLNNNGCTIEGIKIWGSPQTPDLVGWAFGRLRSEMKDHWSYLPTDIDILMTHTPPAGILDKASNGRSLGCDALTKMLPFIEPDYHIFGHIHASYGQEEQYGTTFINASTMDSLLGPVNPPVVFEYP